MFKPFSKIVILTAWIILLILAYRISLIETEHKEYDPFMVLNVDLVNISIILLIHNKCMN